MVYIGTAEASPNMPFVKYWGKRNEALILPMNSNISATFDSSLATRTTVLFSESLKADELWINGKQFPPESLDKAVPQLNIIRELAGIKMFAKIYSISKVPVAAGLSSSSAGLCALALASSSALGLKLPAEELSIICRRGSGSSCRSIYGGFVEWVRGDKTDGSDSYGVQIADEKHWPELMMLAVSIEEAEKKVKSRAGMKQTVLTSTLYQKRLQDIGNILDSVRNAIRNKNFQSLAELTMKESNNLHAVCMDTWPPILYLNDNSRTVINAIHDFNEGGLRAAYTFDAGPNPYIITEEKNLKPVLELLKKMGFIKHIFVSRVGGNPKVLEEHLLNEKGKPV